MAIGVPVMGTRVELGDGHHALLRDPEALTVAQRRPYVVASARAAIRLPPDMLRELQAAITYGNHERRDELLAAASLETIDPEKLDQSKAAAIVALVDSWDLAEPIPQDDPTVLDRLLAHDYDRLVQACEQLSDRIVWRPTAPDPQKSSTRTKKR